MCVLVVIGVSRGPSSYIYIYFWNCSWSGIGNCADVSASIQDVRTEERWEQAYATQGGADSQGGRGFSRGFVIYIYFFFCR